MSVLTTAPDAELGIETSIDELLEQLHEVTRRDSNPKLHIPISHLWYLDTTKETRACG